jgi:hypothetical protein
MNITLAGMDELQHFPDTESRERALREVGSSVRALDWAVGFAICAVGAIGGLWLARMLVRGLLPMVLPWPLHRNVQDLIVFVLVGGTMFLTIRMLHRWGAARALREKLIGLGVPVCRGCGYLLRGLPRDATTCPECGQSIDNDARDLIESSRTESANRAPPPDSESIDQRS